jgi:hypothetical protein
VATPRAWTTPFLRASKLSPPDATSLLAVALAFQLAGCGDGEAGTARNPSDSLTAEDPTACFADTDCVNPEHHSPVESVEQCYCPTCPGNVGTLAPINVPAHTEYESQWQAVCSEWASTNCAPLPCPVTAPPVCRDNICATSD